MKKWRDIKGYEGIYRISSEGDIHSAVCGIRKLIYPRTNNPGYKTIVLRKNGAKKVASVHRLVAQAFIPNPENKPCVNHIDGNKFNNCANNLEWVTYRENNQHALARGFRGKLNEAKVLMIFDLAYKTDLTHREIGEKFDVGESTISEVLSGKKWRIFTEELAGQQSQKRRGEANRKSKLREVDIPVIRRLSELGQSAKKISSDFDVNPSTIERVLRGETWIHV